MKKITVLVAFALLVSSTAFAADSVTPSLTTTGKTLYGGKTGVTVTVSSPLIGKTSTGVTVAVKSASTGYAMWTQHKSGIKAYGSSHDATAIFQSTAVAGTLVMSGAAPTAADSTIFTAANGWSTM